MPSTDAAATRPITPSFIVGVDLASHSDYTALVVLESTMRDGPPLHAVRHLERWQASYPETVRRVRNRLAAVRAPDLDPTASVVVDATGVGRPVLDMLTEAGLDPIGVLIHGGDAVVKASDGTWRVPKRTLVAHLQVVLQSSRLQIARALDLADVLIAELRGFRVEISLRGHDRYGNDVGEAMWREAPHDDLVLATALAVWRGETRPVPMPPPYGWNKRAEGW